MECKTRQIAPARSDRSRRIEFSKAVKLEIFRRAGGPGEPRCEMCGAPVAGKRFEYDHILECWEYDYTGPLTADDGQLLCGTCHDEKSALKSSERAHGNRLREASARIKRKSRPIPGSRASGIRKRMNGTIECW